MPLHAQNSTASRALNGLADIVPIPSHDLQRIAGPINGLMVQAVDPKLLTLADISDTRVGAESNLLCREQAGAVMRVFSQIPDVLMQGSAEHDIDQLCPAADTEQREVPCQSFFDPAYLKFVTLGIKFNPGIANAAVLLGPDVIASTNNQR
jgi:hypothetical protein